MEADTTTGLLSSLKKSWWTGYRVSKDWKKANAMPIFPENYRLLKTTSIPGRLWNKCSWKPCPNTMDYQGETMPDQPAFDTICFCILTIIWREMDSKHGLWDWRKIVLTAGLEKAEVSCLTPGWLVVTSNMPQGLTPDQIMLKSFVTILDFGTGCKFMDKNKLEVGMWLIE